MSRRKASPKRLILPDPIFGSVMLTKFVNVVMQRGKKACAERIVYGALDKVAERISPKDAAEKEKKTTHKSKDSIKTNDKLRRVVLDTWTRALDNVRPTVEVRSRRVGGANYQIPVEVKTDRGNALAMRWLVRYAALRGEKTMALRLAAEILEAMENRGGAVKKREDVHKMAKANQAFAHYRW
jgi:small subunit ribosomal protein S7